ncbi:MAG: FecR family protein [Agriterribacter sp.]
MDIKIIKELLDRYLKGSVSPAEQKLVEEWLEENEFPENEWVKMSDPDKVIWMNQLQDELNKTLENDNSGDPSFISLPWYRRMYFHLAAAVIVIIAVGSWYFLLNEKAPVQQVVVAAEPSPKGDVLPGGNKAILTLDNGATVVLDDSQNGVLAKQGNTEISKNGAQLVYNGNNNVSTAKAVSYNTLTTPRGGQYNLVLPDGSKVWLNAASSLRYPVVFAADKREVEIKGEAYFEVAPQKNESTHVPFIVKVNAEDGWHKGSIEVLGTHFNINAYDEEATVNTTLLEGKVKVLPPGKTGGKPVMLAPGQQSRLNAAGGISVINDADIEEAIAWKNGLFMMNSADISVVLRQLGRWYDVDIIYNKGIPKGKISGDIPRNMNLSEVLKVMELSGVDFEIEGRKIIVEP